MKLTARDRSLLRGFAIEYSVRSQSSKVHLVCYWREVSMIRRQTEWYQTVGQCFFVCDRASPLSGPFV